MHFASQCTHTVFNDGKQKFARMAAFDASDDVFSAPTSAERGFSHWNCGQQSGCSRLYAVSIFYAKLPLKQNFHKHAPSEHQCQIVCHLVRFIRIAPQPVPSNERHHHSRVLKWMGYGFWGAGMSPLLNQAQLRQLGWENGDKTTKN